MRYKMIFSDLPSGAVADTYQTLATLVVADTAGHRLRLRSLQIGPSDDTPQDANLSARLGRVADVSVGGVGTPGSTVSGAAMAKADPGSTDSVVTGGRGHTAEPTTYEAEPLWQMDLNARGGVIKEWGAADAPVCTRDQLLGLLVAPRAAAAVRVSGCLEFEVF